MIKDTKTAHHPIHSNFLPPILKNDNGADPRYLWPMVNSSIRIGIPAVNNANRYGMKNAPPPFSYATYGKRHMFPRPTAEPTAAMIKPARVPHCERSISLPPLFSPILFT